MTENIFTMRQDINDNVDKCKIWLSEYLQEAKTLWEVREGAKKRGFTKGTLTKARHALNVKLIKLSDMVRGKSDTYMWRLP